MGEEMDAPLENSSLYLPLDKKLSVLANSDAVARDIHRHHLVGPPARSGFKWQLLAVDDDDLSPDAASLHSHLDASICVNALNLEVFLPQAINEKDVRATDYSPAAGSEFSFTLTPSSHGGIEKDAVIAELLIKCDALASESSKLRQALSHLEAREESGQGQSQLRKNSDDSDRSAAELRSELRAMAEELVEVRKRQSEEIVEFRSEIAEARGRIGAEINACQPQVAEEVRLPTARLLEDANQREMAVAAHVPPLKEHSTVSDHRQPTHTDRVGGIAIEHHLDKPFAVPRQHASNSPLRTELMRGPSQERLSAVAQFPVVALVAIPLVTRSASAPSSPLPCSVRSVLRRSSTPPPCLSFPSPPAAVSASSWAAAATAPLCNPAAVCGTCPAGHPLHWTSYLQSPLRWVCDGCGRNSEAISIVGRYRCAGCDYDMCSSCRDNARIPGALEVTSNLVRCPYGHAMQLFNSFEDPSTRRTESGARWICDGCENESDQVFPLVRFACGTCDYDLCKECLSLRAAAAHVDLGGIATTKRYTG